MPCRSRGGGLSKDGSRWISCKPGFFLHVRVLSRLFRRLFLDGLLALHRAGELAFFGDSVGLSDPQAFAAYLAPLRKKEWVVYAKPPFAGPEAVLVYRSRYTHRVAISNSRLISADADTVAFQWKNYRIKNGDKQNVMRLSTSEFIRRFLIHVLPRGVPSHQALRLLGQRQPKGQYRKGSHIARRGNRQTRRPAILRDPCAHTTRTMPRLRWADAHHRDFQTRPETTIPSTTQKGCPMTGRMSAFHGHPLKCTPFRAGIGLPKTEFNSFGAPELCAMRLAKKSEDTSDQRQNHTQSTPWINLRRARFTLSPQVSSRHPSFPVVMFPNAGHAQPKPKSRAQTRIEKPETKRSMDRSR